MDIKCVGNGLRTKEIWPSEVMGLDGPCSKHGVLDVYAGRTGLSDYRLSKSMLGILRGT